jgi:hypothetical protein
MARQDTTLDSLLRRLRLSPESLAAAAALHDPGPLLQLQAERLRRDRAGRAPAAPRRPSTARLPSCSRLTVRGR